MSALRSVLEIKDRRDFWVEPMKQLESMKRYEILRKFVKKVERLKPLREKVGRRKRAKGFEIDIIRSFACCESGRLILLYGRSFSQLYYLSK
ncbi:hypothetical protein [Bartonella apihabitans]|uniref:hypothetical protein n=1 Tax=Bartonella apihabitans TaxID=2750929 RepID=UPI00098EDB62